MELRHLRYFVTVAQELNFSRAAARLHVAQPPLSVQIRTLEEELGFKLFVRSKRSVRLTVEGAAFLEHARATLATAENAKIAAAQIATGHRGRLRVGLLPAGVTAGISSSLRHFRESYPNVDLIVRQGSSHELREQLVSGAMDVTITQTDTGGDRRIESKALERHAWLLAMPAHHPLSKLPKIRWKDLNGVRVLGLQSSALAGYMSPLVSECERRGGAPEVQNIANDLQTLIWLVSTGFGVCAYPASLTDIASPGVVFRPMTPPLPELKLSLEWLRGNTAQHLAAFARAFSR